MKSSVKLSEIMKSVTLGKLREPPEDYDVAVVPDEPVTMKVLCTDIQILRMCIMLCTLPRIRRNALFYSHQEKLTMHADGTQIPIPEELESQGTDPKELDPSDTDS